MNRTRTTHRPFRLLCLATPLLLGCVPAAAQSEQPRLEDITVSQPLIIDALGVTVLVPEGATANVTSQPGGKTTAVISAPGALRGSNWVVQVTNERTGDLALSLDGVLDEFAKQRTAQARAANKQFRIFDRLNESANLKIAGRAAARFYCELSPGEGDALMTGYTIFSPKAGEFVIMQLDCLSSKFETSRVLYETIAASTKFEDPLAVAEGRAMALMAGAEFLSTITAEDMKSLLSEEPLYLRYYIPSRTGKAGDDNEVAFQKIQIRDGQAGELDFTRGRENWSAADREYGFLVQVDARAMQASTTIDTRAIHFLSRDRAYEAWSITNTLRDSKRSTSVQQTMIRRDRAMTVKTLREGTPAEVRDWTLPDKGYISEVERYMLPQLVALKNPQSSPARLDFAFFSYDSKNDKLTIRRDEFTNIDIDGWRYTSQPERSEAEIQTILDVTGNLVRRTLDSGIVIEPVTQDRLRRIWKEKGLLME
ncbi:MAG: hypothetical protein KDA20_03070 [Phycisphaerales bacterium]|nr:hypothetical protein [Phycisphaerales bacterium]